MAKPRLFLNKASILLLTSMMLLSVFIPDTSAQTENTTTNAVENVSESDIKKEAAEQGISEADLRKMGIDPSNPDQAIRRARELGVPENQIQGFLARYQTPQTEAAPKGATGMEALASEIEGSDIPLDEFGQIEIPEEITETTTFDTTATKITTSKFRGTGRLEGLTYFGYQTLASGKGKFKAFEIGPVDPGYVIGSGDVLRLYLWGDVELQYEMTVQKNGTVLVPRAGQMLISGTRLEELRDKIHNFLSKFYSGLKTDPPTVFFDVSIARISGNQIYLMGEINSPGAYNISSFSTAFNLMYATGGPRISGSLRNIRVVRDGKIAAKIDFYDYLLKGGTTNDVRLQNNDILFVPPRNTTVAINGEVLHPSIFELKEGESLLDLIEYAGGLKATAYGFHAQIDRIIPMNKRSLGMADHEIIDVDLTDVITNKKTTTLENGDVITIFPYNDLLVNYVDVEGGGIFRSGRYDLAEAKTIKNLVDKAEGLTANAYQLKADLVRTRPDFTQEYFSINLSQAMQGDPVHNMVLEPKDLIKIYARTDWEPDPYVILNGFVANPGRYPLPDNFTLYDLLFQHSGLQDSLRTQRTYMDRGVIYRLIDDGKTRTSIPFILKKVWNKTDNKELVANDIVVLFERKIRETYTRVVTLTGAVKKPGDFILTNNMTLSDLLILGGGFTEEAWLLEAEISRVDLNGLPGEQLATIMRVPIVDWTNIAENPEEMLPDVYNGNTPAGDFLLEPYDQVRIRKNPDYHKPENVVLSGEVVFPGSYTLEKENETLSEIIRRAGGLKPSAHVSGGQLVRDSARLYLDFEELLKKHNRKEDVFLHPGDRIVIPRKPNTVTVMGEVNNPGFYKYLRGQKVRDYLNAAGGKTDDGGRAFVTLPSGRTYELKMLHNPKVKDGSTIRVIPKPIEEENEPIDWSGIIKDTLAIITSAVTIIVLVDKTQ